MKELRKADDENKSQAEKDQVLADIQGHLD